MKHKMIKLLEYNIGEHIHNLIIGKENKILKAFTLKKKRLTSWTALN